MPIDNAVQGPTQLEREQAQAQVDIVTLCNLCGEQGAALYPRVAGSDYFKHPAWASQEDNRRRVAAANAWLAEHRPQCQVLDILRTIRLDIENISANSG